MNVVWKESEREYVRENAGRLTDAEIAARLSKHSGREVSLQAVRKQRQKMLLRKCQGRSVCRLVGGGGAAAPPPKGVAFRIQGGTS
jgi:hypothetical protein